MRTVLMGSNFVGFRATTEDGAEKFCRMRSGAASGETARLQVEINKKAMKKRFFFLFLSLVVVLSASAQAQVKDDDDDDDDAPAKIAVRKPNEQPTGAHFDCPYEKDFRRPKSMGGYVLRFAHGPKDGSIRC